MASSVGGAEPLAFAAVSSLAWKNFSLKQEQGEAKGIAGKRRVAKCLSGEFLNRMNRL
jgi:hypothetical protein